MTTIGSAPSPSPGCCRLLALLTLAVKAMLEWRLGERSGAAFVTVELRGLRKSFGSAAGTGRCQPDASSAANSWRCWDRPAPARPRCCGCSLAWSSSIPATW